MAQLQRRVVQGLVAGALPRRLQRRHGRVKRRQGIGAGAAGIRVARGGFCPCAGRSGAGRGGIVPRPGPGFARVMVGAQRRHQRRRRLGRIKRGGEPPGPGGAPGFQPHAGRQHDIAARAAHIDMGQPVQQAAPVAQRRAIRLAEKQVAPARGGFLLQRGRQGAANQRLHVGAQPLQREDLAGVGIGARVKVQHEQPRAHRARVSRRARGGVIRRRARPQRQADVAAGRGAPPARHDRRVGAGLVQAVAGGGALGPGRQRKHGPAARGRRQRRGTQIPRTRTRGSRSGRGDGGWRHGPAHAKSPIWQMPDRAWRHARCASPTAPDPGNKSTNSSSGHMLSQSKIHQIIATGFAPGNPRRIVIGSLTAGASIQSRTVGSQVGIGRPPRKITGSHA